MLAAAFVWLPQFFTPEELLALVTEGSYETVSVPYLQVHFLDVGQGDATYIETPDGVQVLVDGGTGRQVLTQLAEHVSPLDRQLDMIIGTHPHDDHIGGLVDVLDRFTVEHILVTENRLETRSTERFFAAVEEEATAGAAVYNARAGHTFALGDEATLRVLSPFYDPTDMDADAASIIVQLEYGETAILLTGDAPIAVEDVVVEEYGSGLESEVLKLGHHGSRTSSGELLLDTVVPEYGVTSAGTDSRHGHPHEEVLERVRERGITHVSTQTAGTVSFYSDGERMWLVEE